MLVIDVQQMFLKGINKGIITMLLLTKVGGTVKRYNMSLDYDSHDWQ